MKTSESGSTLIISLITMVALGGFVGLAVDYTSNVARNAQRDRTFANAVEIGDGCVSLAFAAWREASKNSTSQALPTNAFDAIPTPGPSHFPMVSNFTITRGPTPAGTTYTVSNFKIQAVDPLVTLTTENPPVSAWSATTPPPSCTGPGTGTFSYFYLASADVTLPAMKGTLTAKVRRIFEKRYTSPWNWAMLYNGTLELHPDAPLTLNGWVHSNGDAFVGNGDPTATPSPNLILSDRLTYQGNYTVGYDPLDPRSTASPAPIVAAPTAPADLPPGHEQYYSLFGWDTAKFDASNPDATGYHEMIEKPVTPWASGTTADPFKDQRLYNQAAIVVEIDANNAMTVYSGPASARTTMTTQPNGSGTAATAFDAAKTAVLPGAALQDNREGGPIRVIDFDVEKFVGKYASNSYKSWNGIIFIRDTSVGTSVSVTVPGASGPSLTTKRAVRIKNGSKVPTGGMTIVSDNPVYIQGDFNTGRTGTGSGEPGSNAATPDPADPEAGTYKRRPSSVMADAITLLSNTWQDSNSGLGLTSRIASNTTVNAALVAGNVPSNGTRYSGGGENFVRFLEDWTSKNFTYYGSMLNLYSSTQAIGLWGADGTYATPKMNWFFDSTLSVDSSGNPVTVPGYVSTVAYLQQQRWYLEY